MPKVTLLINSQNGRNSYNGSYVLEWPDNNMIDVYVQRQTSDAPSIFGLRNIQSVFRVSAYDSKYYHIEKFSKIILVSFLDQIFLVALAWS